MNLLSKRSALFITLMMMLGGCAANAPQATALPDAARPSAAQTTPTPLIVPTLPPEREVRTETDTGIASVRIAHTVPGLANITVRSGTATIAANLAYGAITNATELRAGSHSLRIQSASAASSTPPLIETEIELYHGDSVTLALTSTGDQYAVLVFPDDPAPLDAGQSAVRIINTIAASAPAAIRQAGSDLAATATFGEAALLPALAAGPTTLELALGTSVIVEYPIELRSRTEHTLIITGRAENPPDAAIIRFDLATPGHTGARVINASTDFSTLDVTIDEAPLAKDISFGRASSRSVVASGDVTVRFYAAGADTNSVEPIISEIVRLNPDQDVVIMLLGSAGQPRILVYAENRQPTPPDRSRVAFVNTLDDVPVVRLQTGGGTLPDVETVTYGQPPVETILAAGEFSFFWTASTSAQGASTIEAAENIQLRAGLSYLYLVTGRLDNQPVILSENVGIDSTLPSADDFDSAGAGGAAAGGPQVRFINAVGQEIALDFLVDDAPIARQVSYSQGTELFEIAPTTPTIRVQKPGGDRSASLDAAFTRGSAYTIIAYGPDESDIRLLLIPDGNLVFDGQSPYVRLVNLSLEPDIPIGLGFSLPNLLLPTAPAALEATPDPTADNLRRSIPAGIQILVNGVQGGSFSSIVLMPVGIYNLEILDMVNNRLVYTLPAYPLEANQHYDVFAFRQRDSDTAQAFVVPYPGRLDWR